MSPFTKEVCDHCQVKPYISPQKITFKNIPKLI